MTKTAQPQGAFSFLDEVEKLEPLPRPKKNTLTPPSQIEVEEEISIAEEKEEPIIAAAAEPAVVPEEIVAAAPEEAVERRPAGTRGRRSVKENSIAADAVEMPEEEELFKKHYYSMGEVTALFKESHSLIRYWESEFDILKPKKNGKGDRFFRPQDVKNLFLIYDLLRRKKFTIEGAKEYLKNNKKADERFAAVQSLQRLKGFLLELKAGI
ncbi:MAG: MerR family transcriptional regulator [Niabella sp.]|nr:MerR family transcriptional regulator [Niabella sp.]